MGLVAPGRIQAATEPWLHARAAMPVASSQPRLQLQTPGHQTGQEAAGLGSHPLSLVSTWTACSHCVQSTDSRAFHNWELARIQGPRSDGSGARRSEHRGPSLLPPLPLGAAAVTSLVSFRKMPHTTLTAAPRQERQSSDLRRLWK